MFRSQVLLFTTNKIYNLDLSPLAFALDRLRILYFDQYGDFTTGTVEAINQIFEVGSKALNAYKYLASEEADPLSIKDRRKQYTQDSLISVFDDLISKAEDILNASEDFYQFKAETWYKTGIEGIEENKPGSALLGAVLDRAREFRNALTPTQIPIPGSRLYA